MIKQSEVGTRHEHESPLSLRVGERSVGLALEFYLPIFNPLIHILGGCLASLSVSVGGTVGKAGKLCPVLLTGEPFCRRRHRQVDGELRTTTRINRLVNT